MRNGYSSPNAQPRHVRGRLGAVWISVLLLLGFAATLCAGEPLQILFIGNSYTYYNDMPTQVADLATADGTVRPMQVRQITIGGQTLEGHWNTPSTVDAVGKGAWDYVVLQEQSTRPFRDPELFFQYARLFDGVIQSIGAQTVFYLTWARQNQPERQDDITAAYTSIAEELGAGLAPVGIAWQNAFAADPSLVLHISDQSHPNTKGSYLAACVFFATFYAKSPEGLPNNYGLSDEDAAFLQGIAWQTVSGGGAKRVFAAGN